MAKGRRGGDRGEPDQRGGNQKNRGNKPRETNPPVGLKNNQQQQEEKGSGQVLGGGVTPMPTLPRTRKHPSSVGLLPGSNVSKKMSPGGKKEIREKT